MGGKTLTKTKKTRYMWPSAAVALEHGSEKGKKQALWRTNPTDRCARGAG